jgi:purine nucleosidase
MMRTAIQNWQIPMKILLDTDIGSDIDDAAALAYLLAHPQAELMGITTVSGETRKRAMMVSALCKAAGKDIPIYPGREAPLLVPQQQTIAHQAAALGHWPHETHFPSGQAIPFLIDTIRSNPGQITMLTIGPLTNLAALLAADPEIPSLLKSLVMMCGVFTNRLAGVGPLEWNALLDPHAAAIAYHHPFRIHRSIGLDVTAQVTLNASEVRSRFQAPLLNLVLDFAEIWFQQVEVLTFHDPLAAVILFDDRICGFERGQVTVELLSSPLAGLTHWTPAPGGPHEVALSVDADRFFEQYFSVF